MTCDVYSSIRNDIIVNGANDTANTTIEIFLLNVSFSIVVFMLPPLVIADINPCQYVCPSFLPTFGFHSLA